jgi:hypothetical protein
MISILTKAAKIGIAFGVLATLGLTVANAIYWSSTGIELGDGIHWPTYLVGAVLYYFLPLTVFGAVIGCVALSISRLVSRRAPSQS